MRIFRLTTLSLVAFFVASKWGNLPHEDKQTLQGTWEIVSVERAGNPDPSAVGLTLKFAGPKLHFERPFDEPAPVLTLTELKPTTEEQSRQMLRS